MKKFTDIVTDTHGEAVNLATVTVVNYPSSSAATIFSDDVGTVVSGSVVTTDSTGTFSFYAAPGRYNLQVRVAGALLKTITDVQIDEGTDEEVGTFAALLGTIGRADGQIVTMASYYAGEVPDGGGGQFKWSSTSTATHNAGTVIKPTAVSGAGRWLALGDTSDSRRFGARGDAGTTDNTTYLQAALNALTNGCTLVLPPGKVKVTGELVMPTVGGISIVGHGAVDFIHGSPVPSGLGTYIYQATNNKAIFTHSGGTGYARYADLSLGPAVTPTDTPLGTSKIGIKISDTLPNVLWQFTFDRVVFFNLDYGVQCIDTAAGATSQDLSVAPAVFNQCFFVYPDTGVYLETNNTDNWVWNNCSFFIPSGGDGVYVDRAGLLFFRDCLAGGVAVSNNRFLTIKGTGLNSVDHIVLDGVQAETLTQFIAVLSGGGYTAPFVIEARNCHAELGADVYLGNNVHFISRNCFWSNIGIVIDDADVLLSTHEDEFLSGAAYSFLAGSADTSFYNTVWGPNPEATYSGYTFLNGDLVRRAGTTSVNNTTDTTAYTVPDETATYLFSAYLADGGSTYAATALITWDGTNLIRVTTDNGAGVEIKVSGSNIQLWQNSGVTQSMSWRFQRI